jgi:competence protein ComEC
MRNHLASANRAPLAYLLVSLIAGLLLARITTAGGLTMGLLGLGGAVSSVLLLQWKGWAIWLWGPVFLLSGTAVFCSYGSLRLPPVPDAVALSQAPREARVKMQLIRIFNNNATEGDKVRGIAQVLPGPAYRHIKPGARIYFNLQAGAEDAPRLHKGVQIESVGVLRTLRYTQASGFYQYLRNNGVNYRFSQNATMSITREAGAFRNFCMRQNERFRKILTSGAEGAADQARVYTAMLLGARAGLNQDQKDRYQASGAMHLFAISGLHIGVIATALASCLKLIRIPNQIAPFLGLPLLYLYVEITGGTPSAMRAFLMTLFFWTAYTFQRQRNPFAALMASALGVLLADPLQLWSLGFQLSYAVVASILLLGLPLQGVLTHWARPFRWLPEDDWTRGQRLLQRSIDCLLLLFSISFSAWLASIPLSLGHFGYLSLPAVFINMLLVNMAALVICTGCLSLATGLLLWTGLAPFFNHAAWLVIACMDALSGWVAAIPGAVLESKDFPLPLCYGALLAYFACLILVNRKPAQLNAARLLAAPVLLALFVGGTFLWT